MIISSIVSAEEMRISLLKKQQLKQSTYIHILCLSVCLIVCPIVYNKRQNGCTDQAQILGGTSRDLLQHF